MNLEVITSEMDELHKQKELLKFDLKQIEKEIEKKELELTNLLKIHDVNEMQTGIYSFGFKISQRTAFDSSLFKEKEPELFEKFKTTKEYTKFEFKINK